MTSDSIQSTSQKEPSNINVDGKYIKPDLKTKFLYHKSANVFEENENNFI